MTNQSDAAGVKGRPGDPDLRSDIARALYDALKIINAPRELLAIVGRWGDTMGDEDTLAHLRSFNHRGSIFRR